MTPFVIFLLAITFIYIVYYAVIITIDLNAKPKGEAQGTETIDTGMEDTQSSDDDADEAPYIEQQDQQEDIPQSEVEELTEHYEGDTLNGETLDYIHEEHQEESETEATAETDSSLSLQNQDDDDIYGLGDGDEENDTPPNGIPEDDNIKETVIAQETTESDSEQDPKEDEIGVSDIYEPSNEAEKTADYLSNIGEGIIPESTTPVSSKHSETILSSLGIKRETHITKI